MLAFPQLSSSAMAQFPNQRGLAFRTAVVETQGGVAYRTSDDGASGKVWTLALRGLRGDERSAIDELFEAAEGRLRTFVFLDTQDNLLIHSSSFTAGVWSKQAGLVIRTGEPDPLGGSLAATITNPTNNTLWMNQTLSIPGSYQYCLSAYVKNGAGTATKLLMGPPGHMSSLVTEGYEWRRFEFSKRSGSAGEMLLAGVEVAPLSEMSVFGFQLEPALRMSSYKATAEVGGVYQRCRFAQDAIEWVTDGPDEHSVELRISTVR